MPWLSRRRNFCLGDLRSDRNPVSVFDARHVGDIHGRDVHADSSDNRREPVSYLYETFVGQPAVYPFVVAGRNSGNLVSLVNLCVSP